MARVTAEEAARTRERLLDAALEVFWEHGVARPSLTKVAERAGMTRGAIYGHFDNKEDVFSALCDRFLLPAAVLEQLRQDGADDPLGTLVAWVQSILRDARADPCRRRFFEILLLKCEAVEGDDIRGRMRRDFERARLHEEALLCAAVRQGQVPADLDVPLAALILHATIGGLLRHLALHPEAEADLLVERIGGLVCDMLRGEALRRA
ncbi:MAG: TetR family transcriptional regulator [Alphaproteobacteria bacterium]|nr:TetR family transcriptional regulator [Alphaproteobacteria bacterium]